MACLDGITSAVPPAFSIFSFADAENADALTTSFFVSSPSPRIFTVSIERGTMPGPCSAATSTVPDLNRFSRSPTLTAKISTRNGFLNPFLGKRRCIGI